MAKRGKNSPSSSWCLLRQSNRLRTAAKYKIEEKNLKLVQLADKAGVPVDRLSRWINNRWPNMTQYQCVKVCKTLGIEVTLDIKIVE